MKNSVLHIVSFNVPFPANYGGVIDVFFKIKALHQLGIKIILHSFAYGRSPAKELEEFCHKIFYYHRPTSIGKQFSITPFIVKTRNSQELLKNLLSDDFPILFEGLHTCYFLDFDELKLRKKIIRMHNVEWEYYAHLGKMEKNWFKKIYFNLESSKLKYFEKKINQAQLLLPISKNDATYFKTNYPAIPNVFIPAFHPNELVEVLEGKGKYILFHGDLSVKDNEESVMFLLEKIVQSVDYQWIVAGLNPADRLKDKIESIDNVILKPNLSNLEMESMIQNAHVNILLSFQSAGMKLKLLNALFKGRFCVVNEFMVKNTGLENLCSVVNRPEEIIQTLNQLMNESFSTFKINERIEKIEQEFSNKVSAQKVIQSIFEL